MSDSTLIGPGREQDLVRLHAQLSAALLERGLQFARADSPEEYQRAADLRAAGAGHFELRICVDDGTARTTGVIVDAGGEVLAVVFRILAGSPVGMAN